MTSDLGQRPLFAAACVVAAMALLGLTDNLVAMVAEDTGLWQFHLARALMGLPVILGAAWYAGRRLWPKRPVAVLVRSFLVSASMFFYFGALAFISVAQSAAGLFTAPIWVLLISFLVFGDRITWFKAGVVVIGFAGVMLVLQPNPAEVSPAIIMPVIAGIFYAFSAIATRRYCAQEGALTLLVWFFIFMVLWGLGGCIVLEIVKPDVLPGPDGFLLRGLTPISWGWIALIGVQALGAVIGVGLIFWAYLLAEASFVSVFEYSMLVFGAFWGWVLWGQTMNGFAVLGVGLIVVSGLILARGERAPRGGGGVSP